LPYWPANVGQTVSFGPFDVFMTSQKEDESLIERVFDLQPVGTNVYVRRRHERAVVGLILSLERLDN
jgi:hypothetical protein